MARTNQRGRNNNNAEGRNQYSGGWMDSAKDKPFTTAAAAAAAVGAGVFLWSRRNQISEQISNLSEQIGDWSQSMRSDSRQGSGERFALEAADSGSFESTASNRGSKPRKSGNGASGRGMSETGAGNASLGAHSGTTGRGAAS